MSMYRQLWLAIILSTLLALLGVLLASTLSARDYLVEQFGMKNADNASALALALSQQQPDEVSVELAVSALFDSGHYELIRVVDPHGKTLVERKAPNGEYDAPRWFVARLPIAAPPGQAQISSGWKQFGTVTLVSHSRFAYRALWRSVVEMIGAMALAGFVGGYLGTMILRRLRRPLNAVIGQAQAITERRFITIDEPDVPELRQLTVAMNATVSRLKTMFEDEAVRLEALRREANCDPLTGLANRNFFMAQLHESIMSEETSGGTLLLVRVVDLAGINRRHGRDATDELLRRFAKAVAKTAERHATDLAARLNGADFAVLLVGESHPRTVADDLLRTLVQESVPFVDNEPIACIGLGSFPHGQEQSTLLSQVDVALAAAEAEGNNSVREASSTCDNGHTPHNAEAWGHMFHHALEQRWVRLVSFPVVALDGRLMHRECPLRLMFDAQGEWQPAGKFLPMAERLKLTPQVDLAAIALGLKELQEKPHLPGLAVNLSASSVADDDFRRQLLLLLKRHAGVVSRLWLEVAEFGVFKHFNAFRTLCSELRSHKCRLGVEHFGRQFSQVGLLHDLGLDYLKVDSSFIRGLDGNPGNQAFLKGLSSIAHSIGLQVIAEGVMSEAELKALAAVGFDGATGPAVKDAGT